MAILGYNTKDSASLSNMAAGRMYVSKFTLASASTMSELHAWLGTSGAVSAQARLVIYAADGASGAPGTRLAYSATKTYSGETDVQESGFSVSLAAADYWIGWSCISGGSGGAVSCFGMVGASGSRKGIVGGVADPPPTPFGSPDNTAAVTMSVWAVVTAGGGAPAFVPQIVIT